MIGEIIAIGDELTSGRVLNTTSRFAAGLLLVEEAGGKATDFQGRRWNTTTQGYIASNGLAHQRLVKIMKPMRAKARGFERRNTKV